jgi:hypothetical protein
MVEGGGQGVKRGSAVNSRGRRKSLLLRLRTEIRVRHYSPKTERADASWALRFMAFRRGRDPSIPPAAPACGDDGSFP